MALPRIRITGREEQGDYRVFRVDRLTLEIEQAAGQPPRVRDAFVFRTPDWCNVLALTANEEIVFVRQFRFGTDSDTLELPGGVIDPGESPRTAALRELREESGYEPPDPSSVEPLLEIFANPALQGTRVHTFLARGVVLSASGTHFDDSEHCELVLLPLRELVARLDAGEITHSLCRLPLELFLRKEASAGRRF